MQIPKGVKIGRHRYAVHTVARLKRGRMGAINYEDKKITLAAKSSLSGKSFRREDMSETFWHEIVHGILHDMKHPLWDNEPFVEAFSTRLNRIVHTAEV